MKKIIIFALLGVSIVSIIFLLYSMSAVKNSDIANNDQRENISVLDLSDQGLERLPEYVLESESLLELDLSGNNLKGALPSEIGKLKNLEKLDVSDNIMTGIPAEIGQLEKLEELSYANNEITGLPLEISNLENLKTLDLSGNDYAIDDLEKIKEKLPELVVKGEKPKEEALSEPEVAEELKPVQAEEKCDTGTFENQFLCLINKYRNNNGKSKLAYSTNLNIAALDHSKWMNETNNFDHTGKDGSHFTERCIDAGEKCDAENLALGASTAQKLFDIWKGSVQHNKNMLDNHSLLGLGRAGSYSTAVFQ